MNGWFKHLVAGLNTGLKKINTKGFGIRTKCLKKRYNKKDNE